MQGKEMAIPARLLWFDSTRLPTQWITWVSTAIVFHSLQGHTQGSGSKHFPGDEHSPYISVPTWSLKRVSHHHTSDSAGQRQQSKPERLLGNLALSYSQRGMYTLFQSTTMFSQETKNSLPTSSSTSLHFTWFFLAFFPLFVTVDSVGVAPEQGPWFPLLHVIIFSF